MDDRVCKCFVLNWWSFEVFGEERSFERRGRLGKKFECMCLRLVYIEGLCGVFFVGGECGNVDCL